MTKQSFDILCPVCRSVVPPDASGCPVCAARAATPTATASRIQPPPPIAAAAVPGGRPVGEVGEMSMKEYHRFVKRSMGYGVAGQARTDTSFGAWLPALLLLLLGLVVAVALTFGWL